MSQLRSPPKATPNRQQQMAHQLFKQVFEAQKIKQYSSLPQNKIKQICKEASYLFYRKLKKKPNQTLAFLQNYHRIILSYNQKVINQMVNNISLHFILLSSYAMIENQRKNSAKQLLKKALDYLGSTDPDPILLTTALNNLCMLRMQQGKYYKSIQILIKMTHIMQDHMRLLKYSKNTNQIVQDCVFLINSYYLLTKCLSKIMQKNNREIYKNLFKHNSRTGLRKSIKYLGRQSFLTKQFLKIVNQHQKYQLPIFIQQISQKQKTSNQQKILRKLQQLQQMLNKREPIIIKQIIKQQAPPPPPPVPIVNKIQQQQDLVCRCSRTINNWNVQVQILKQKTQKLGNVVFNCRKDKDYINLIINQQRMYKLLTQMNINDILPDQCSMNNLAPHQFIELLIFPFFYIDDNKNMELFPRAHTIINPFITTIFNREAIVFLYHIRGNQFRLAFGQKGQSQTYYLQVQLQQQYVLQILQITNQIQPRIYQVYNDLMISQEKQHNFKYNGKNKQIRVKNQSIILRTMQGILAKFQAFIQNHLSDATLDDIFKQSNQFFKYFQNKNFDQGKFYYVRFLSNIKGFDVYVENTFETFKPDGKSKAKGNILFNSYQFFRDFGITSQNALSKFRCFCQILCKKYSLRSFQSPLNTKDLQTYQQNSISQVKVTCKTFLRKMRHHKNNVFPLTACLISIDNQIPVGIKLTGYNNIACIQVGYFIYIPQLQWKWPQKQQQQMYDFINGVVEQYGYKKNYFLVNWLERFGYKKMIELLKVDNEDNFYIQGVYSNFFRIENVIDNTYNINNTK